MESIRRTLRGRQNASDDSSPSPDCQTCSHPGWSKSIKSDGECKNLCERCRFLRDVVKKSIEIGLLKRSGTSQEVSWSEEPWYSEKGNPWSDFGWTIWNNRLGNRESRFELFTLPGSPKPFSDFPEKALPDNTGSLASLLKVQEWLDICPKTHKSCVIQSSGPPILPKRVVDVSSSRVRLYETKNETNHYTLQLNEHSIDWETIPKTFRDAIDFTRRLGLKYIWIDSICIIQKDPTDWAQQSTLMASIYENAYVTLCATASTNDNGGCYSSATHSWQPRRLHILKKGIEYEVYIRCDLDQRHIPDWHAAVVGFNANRFPLMTRGWTYQERLLSRRLVHFTKGELMWECSELSDCECSQGAIGKRSPFMQHHSPKAYHRAALTGSHLKTIEKYWNEIIFAYSGLNLTMEKDKLPALSGVVKQMLRFRPGDEYLAGLWRNTIITDLHWMRWSKDCQRPANYRSPSWSWASINGIVYTHGYDSYSESNVSNYAKCVDVSVTLAGPDPTGEVSSGYIILDAPFKIATLENNPDSKGSWDRWSLEVDSFVVNFSPDCNSDFIDGSIATGDKLLCLRLGETVDSQDMCLVLKRRSVDGATPLYQRVGYLTHKGKNLKCIGSLRKRRIHR